MTTELVNQTAGCAPVTYAVSLACDSSERIEDLATRFYERYEGVLASRDGAYIVTQDIDECDGFAAGRQAIQDVESIGLSVRKVDRDLVDIPEIAQRAGVTRQAVANWADGRRSKGFPPPLGSTGGKRIWAWGQIVPWLQGRGNITDEPLPLSLDDAARLDVWLIERREARESDVLRAVGRTVVTQSSSAGFKGQYKNVGATMYKQVPRNGLIEK